MNESVIASAPGPGFGGRRAALAVVVVLVCLAALGVVVWRSREAASPDASAPPRPRASELYAADGTTLIARFDTDDPRESCLRVPVNDWGYFCDHVVRWWQGQAAFGADAAQRLDRLRHGGYRIGGSLDPRLQAGAKQRHARPGRRWTGHRHAVMIRTMDFELSPARAADYDEIVAVVDDWWGRAVSGLLPRLFLDHFHRTSLVARDHDGVLAGFLVGVLSPSQPGRAYIHFVGVAPAARGCGLGRRLYDGFFALARAAGSRGVGAITSPVNAGSIAFHQSMGFAVTGPVVGYDGPGKDMMVFDRAL